MAICTVIILNYVCLSLHLTAGRDYLPISSNLVFARGSGEGTQTCTYTQILSDGILETATESFSIVASPFDEQSRVNIPANQQVTLVTIVDTNRKLEWIEECNYLKIMTRNYLRGLFKPIKDWYLTLKVMLVAVGMSNNLFQPHFSHTEINLVR